MKTEQEILSGLNHFYGSEGRSRGTFGMKLTDGVRWLCDSAECFWLVDVIGNWQSDSRIKNDEHLRKFQIWTLKTHSDKSASLILERDFNDVVLTQEIGYTDFPVKFIQLYYSPEDKVILLPNEY